tara:strand:- start:504 stop:1298 length:795 start_codon:yes stop_codon:yes gene_type:complete
MFISFLTCVVTFNANKIGLVGIPYDKGTHIYGSALGPEKVQGILRENIDMVDTNHNDYIRILNDAKKKVSDICMQGKIPVCIGCDHSVTIASASAMSSKFPSILWMDAHAEFNTPEMSILHGLGKQKYTTICDETYTNDRIHLFGIRDVDPEEIFFLKSNNITCTPMSLVHMYGADYCMRRALSTLTNRIHVSFDMDVMDPLYCPGVSTKVPNGMDLTQLDVCLDILRDSRKIASMDIVEYNPLNDFDDKTGLCIRYMLNKLFV